MENESFTLEPGDACRAESSVSPCTGGAAGFSEPWRHPPGAGEKLVLFTRYPAPGRSKTRLMPVLGADGAAGLQEIMTGWAVLNARCHAAASGAAVEIAHEGAGSGPMRRWLGGGLAFTPQGGGDLGRRMHRAFQRAFRRGFERVVLMGCDCPRIDPQCLAAAFHALRDHDGVIGPAADGGYYLIGLKKPAPELFAGMDWGTGSVFRRTLSKAHALRLQLFRLPTLPDIDRPADLKVCREMGFFKADADAVTVMIAALDENAHIETTVARALDGAAEVIVADGGSRDGTPGLARRAGASILTAPVGRGCRFNMAALKAAGDILIFLHADTLLPAGYAAAVVQALNGRRLAGGAFRLQVDASGYGIRLAEKGAALRSRWLGLPYGDQALFMRKTTFLRMGGFADLPIMEDYEFVQRLRRRGRVALMDKAVRTSGRRWLALGLWRTTLINQLMVAGYKAGISPGRLATFYRGRKSAG